VNMNPVGDWTTQTEDPFALLEALGDEIVKQRARAGDRGAQYSQGYNLVSEADGAGTSLGAAGRTPKSDVGFALTPHRTVPGLSPDCDASCGHLMT